MGKAILPLSLTIIRHQQEDQVHFVVSMQKGSSRRRKQIQGTKEGFSNIVQECWDGLEKAKLSCS